METEVKIRHLRYDLYGANLVGEKRHAQEVMKEFGITYQYASSHSIGEQWRFWNCENIPEELPNYIEIMDLDPMGCIGIAFDLETAKEIRDYKSQL